MKLVERMPRVGKTAIKAKGGYLMYSLLFHDVENSKNKEKPLNE